MANFEFVEPSPSVEIALDSGQTIRGDRGSTLEQFLKVIQLEQREIIMGAIVNHELRELTHPVEMDSKVSWVTMEDADGARIYRRSLTFLLEAVFEDLFPDAQLEVDHSVTSGGFFCEVVGRPPLSFEEINQIKDLMGILIRTNLKFERQQVPLKEAIDYFASQGNMEKVRLLKYRQKEFLILYRLENHRDYHHGYMLPSTGYIKWFDLTPAKDGFIINYPRRTSPTQTNPVPSDLKLLNTFREYGNWLQRLGIESVGSLNDAISAGKIREVILVSEALHEQRIAEIASKIASDREKIRIVLISGPSSSGKTTFSKRLAVQLISQGVQPYPLEMDNYFVNRDQTPRDNQGNYDFESIEALDVPQLNEDLQALIRGESVQIPHYNFRTGMSEPGDLVRLEPGQLIILEGIHGLNPRLITDTPSEYTYRIYVSALTQLNLDRYNRISTTDTRLIRRIVRDARERGYSAQQTISRWDSVGKGEKNHIFPYQENADTMFNSALAYELSALRLLAEPLLRQVQYGTREYIEAKRLLALLEWFLPVDRELIPDNSILREFIGGSILADFKLWKNENGNL
jgi:uridine kinase